MVQNPPADVRASFDLDTLVSVASNAAGYAVAPGEVALVLMGDTVNSLYEKHSARVYWDLWDKETPINGVDPSVVLGRPDYNGGEIYLIWVDDRIVILQPHMPDATAPVWADEAHEVASLHAAQMVDEFVLGELIQTIVAGSTPPEPTVTMEQLQELLSTSQGRQRRNPRGQ